MKQPQGLRSATGGFKVLFNNSHISAEGSRIDAISAIPVSDMPRTKRHQIDRLWPLRFSQMPTKESLAGFTCLSVVELGILLVC